MKKSKCIQLVLITGLLAACSSPRSEQPLGNQRLHMRTDTSGRYTRAHGGMGYYAFLPFGIYAASGYQRSGYYNNSLHSSSSAKGPVSRGGFGRSGFHVGA